MDDKTKIYIGVGVVAAIGFYWWYTHKSSSALASTTTAPKLSGTSTPAGGAPGAPGGGTPSGGSTALPFIGPMAPAAAPGGAVMSMPAIYAQTSAPAPAPAPSPLGQNSVQGPYGPISWTQGGTFDPSTGIITNSGAILGGVVVLTLPTMNSSGVPDGGTANLNLSPGYGFNTGTVNKNDYGTVQ